MSLKSQMWINLGVLCVHLGWVDRVVVPTAALVCACMRACVRACMRACVRACLRACVRACVRACLGAHHCMCACVCGWAGVCMDGWVGALPVLPRALIPVFPFPISLLHAFHSFTHFTPYPSCTLQYTPCVTFTASLPSPFFLSSFYPHSFSSSIKLMTSGRMKGQAFVSYSSTEEAAEALEETNGYKLQDKPIVVVSSSYSTTTGPYKFTIN